MQQYRPGATRQKAAFQKKVSGQQVSGMPLQQGRPTTHVVAKLKAESEWKGFSSSLQQLRIHIEVHCLILTSPVLDRQWHIGLNPLEGQHDHLGG